MIKSRSAFWAPYFLYSSVNCRLYMLMDCLVSAQNECEV